MDIQAALQEVVKGMGGKGGGGKPKVKKSGGKPRVARKPKEPAKCECGCGKLTKGGHFLPGHDARLKSRLKKSAADGNEAAKAELRKRRW